jgi:hypothetical protein
MNKLYIYGCSHSAGNLLGYDYTTDLGLLKLNDGIRFVETPYTKWLGRIGNPFYVELSKQLGLEWHLRAQGGHSNQQQFKRLLSDLHKITKNDTIIFQFTHFIRFEVPQLVNGKWESDGWQKGGDLVFEDTKYQHFYLTHLDFEVPFIIETIKQILTLLKYIETNIGAKVFIWSMDNISDEINQYTKLAEQSNLITFEIDGETYNHLAGVTNFINRNEHLIIKYETKGAVDDMHFGELGHKLMYENILKFVKK